MYKTKTLDAKEMRELFCYDESSKSCLKWAKDIKTGEYYSKVNVTKGDDVGAVSGNYFITSVNKRRIKVHRVVYTICVGEIPDGYCIEHMNGNGLDNRICNLRLADRKINMQNRKMQRNNKTGIVGVEYTVREGRSPYYTASWYDMDGKHVRKCFAVSKYGDEVARDLAISARIDAITLLNLSGCNYTERHLGGCYEL